MHLGGCIVPGIRIRSHLAAACNVVAPANLGPHRLAAILVDLPAPELEIVRQLEAIAPDAGLLFLAYDFDLGEILPLLHVVNVARRDPGRRVLFVVNVRHCHHIRHALKRHPKVQAIPIGS